MPLTRGNTYLTQPDLNLSWDRSRPDLIPAPPVRRAGSRGQVTPTKHFTASTCPKCGDITITGTTYGLHLHLEPHMLNDQTEYNALHDQVPTYDLWPDRIARRRHHAHITHPTRVPRHAQHTCHTTYGTTPRPTPPAQPHAAPHSDTPPF